MKKTKKRMIIGLGFFCLLLNVISSWYSMTFNSSRLVAPMDYSVYVFHPRDLPMILSLFLTFLYVFCLLIIFIKTLIKNGGSKTQSKVTRKLNSKLGCLGFMGFLGFSGFWTYHFNKIVSPFVFFLFFGFFGFFYEGKMSNTFMDERFKENAMKAQLTSYKIGLSVIFLLIIVLGQGAFMGNLEYTLIFLMIGVSLTLALVLFLTEYLLYRYDHNDQLDNEV